MTPVTPLCLILEMCDSANARVTWDRVELRLNRLQIVYVFSSIIIVLWHRVELLCTIQQYDSLEKLIIHVFSCCHASQWSDWLTVYLWVITSYDLYSPAVSPLAFCTVLLYYIIISFCYYICCWFYIQDIAINIVVMWYSQSFAVGVVLYTVHFYTSTQKLTNQQGLINTPWPWNLIIATDTRSIDYDIIFLFFFFYVKLTQIKGKKNFYCSNVPS